MANVWKQVGTARALRDPEGEQFLCQLRRADGEWITVHTIDCISDDFAYTNAQHWVQNNARKVAS